MPKKLFVGVDLGGTDTKFSVVDEQGLSLLKRKLPKISSLVDQGPRVTVEQFVKGIEQTLESAGVRLKHVAAVGLCTPGPASREGVLSFSGNLRHKEWVNFNIRKALEERLAIPVRYSNDATAAGYGEYLVRRDQERLRGKDRENPKSLALITMGTGLGGAYIPEVVFKGELLGLVVDGDFGHGAEFGHVNIVAQQLWNKVDPVRCGCGRVGCAEAYASLRALDWQLREELRKPEYSKHPLQDVADEGIKRALRLLRLAENEDVLALSLFDRQAEAVGMLFAQILMMLDVSLLVVGGGITEGARAFKKRYLRLIDSTVRSRAFPAQKKGVRIEYAIAGDRAGSYGVANMARLACQSE